MKQQHFKILELDEVQILIQREFTPQNGKPQIRTVFFLDGIKIDVVFEYETESDRNEFWASFTETEAQKLFNDFKKTYFDENLHS